MSKRLRHIAQYAYNLLGEVGITKAPISVHKITSYLNLEVITHDFGKEISGALVIEDGKSVIGVSPNESEVRRRFTICHEIGHYLFHKDSGQLFIDNKKFQVMFRSDEVSQDYNQEKEANHFAASILMPEHLIEQSIFTLYEDEYIYTDEEIIRSMSKEFKVSQPAMTFRLINLGFFKN